MAFFDLIYWSDFPVEIEYLFESNLIILVSKNFDEGKDEDSQNFFTAVINFVPW
jgi:hypothetical protein